MSSQLLRILQLRCLNDQMGEKTKEMLDRVAGPVIALCSLAIAIFMWTFLYMDKPNQKYDNTDYYGLTVLGARNILFTCSIILGVTALGSGLVYLVAKDSYGARLYSSAIEAYQHNFLHTTTSVLVLALWFVWSDLPKDSAGTDIIDKTEFGWLPGLSVALALVIKILIEIKHSSYIEDEGPLKPDGSLREGFFRTTRLMGLMVLTGVLLYMSVNFTPNWGNPDWKAGSSIAVAVIIMIYIGLQALESTSEEDARKGLFGTGLMLSQLTLSVSYFFLGWFLSQNKNSGALFVCLMFLYVDGLQIGMIQKGKAWLSDKSITGLYRLVQIFLGLVGFIVLVEKTDGKLTTSDIHEMDIHNIGGTMNATAIANKEGYVEALSTVMYSVALAASVVKFAGGAFGLLGPVRSPSPEQVFRKFSSTALLISSTILWVGGADFLASLPEEYKLNPSVALMLFIVALINRIIDSYVDSTMDDDPDLQKSLVTRLMDFGSWYGDNRNDGEDGLNKASVDNVRTWMVLGALSLSLGLTARYGSKNWANIDGKENLVERNYYTALVLICVHIAVVVAAIATSVVPKIDRLALSKSSLIRLIVSTSVLCSLVVLVGQTAGILDTGKHIEAPDSAENNIVGALVAYLFADALGAEFL